MADWVLFHWSLAKAFQENSRVMPRWIPDLPLTVIMDLAPETERALSKDSDPGVLLMLQAFKDDAKRAFDDSVKIIASQLQAFDDECVAKGGDIYDYVESRKHVMEQIERDIQEAKVKAANLVQQRWMQFHRIRPEYKSYRLATGIRVIKGAAGVGGAAAGLAGAAATGGAGLAIAIIATYRAVADAGKTVWDCWITADQAKERVKSGLESLQKTYEQSHKLGVAREVAAGAVNPVLNLPAATNASTIENDLKQWRGKLAHLHFLAQWLSGKLGQMLQDSTSLRNQLATYPRKQKALEGIEKQINALLTEGVRVPGMRRRVEIGGAYQAAEKGLDEQEKISQALEELKAGRSKGVDWCISILKYAVGLALTGAHFAIQPPDSPFDVTKVNDAAKQLKEVNLSNLKGAVKSVSEATEVDREVASNLMEINDIVAENSERVKEYEKKLKEEIEQGAKHAVAKALTKVTPRLGERLFKADPPPPTLAVPTRPRSDAIGGMADAKAKSIAAGKAKP